MSTRPDTRAIAGRYRLRERIATGGMGQVWRADDEHLRRPVALKLMRPGLAEDPTAMRRFRREAYTAASLLHPNIAAVLDLVEDDGEPALVMELVEGETLRDRVRRDGPLPIETAVPVLDGLLAALAAAHSAGVVHRDVTPGNVMLASDGRVKVTDFGIAAAVGDTATRLTDPGTVLGTAAYLSPEQVRGEHATPESDQYAAAAVAYEALTGSPPFRGDTMASTALARLERVPPDPREHRPEIPAVLAGTVLRGLEPDPAKRHPSVGEMRGAIRSATGHATAPDTTQPTDTADTAGAVGAVGAADTTLETDATTLAAGHPEAAGVSATSTQPLPAPAAASGAETARTGPSTPATATARRASTWLALAAGAAVFLLGFALAVALRGDGAELASVSDHTGAPVAEATARAEQQGLAVEADEVPSDAPEGTVVAQDVAPGTRVASGSTLTLEVSSGTPPCCTVPGVVGLDAEDAETVLAKAGLTVGEVTRSESDFPEDVVVTQDPEAAATAEADTAVDLVVSDGDGDDDDEKNEGGPDERGPPGLRDRD